VDIKYICLSLNYFIILPVGYGLKASREKMCNVLNSKQQQDEHRNEYFSALRWFSLRLRHKLRHKMAPVAFEWKKGARVRGDQSESSIPESNHPLKFYFLVLLFLGISIPPWTS